MQVSVVRFFLVVCPAPAWLLAGFAVLAVIGSWTVMLNPRDVDAALANILVLQMFAVSTGLTTAAARGHLDPLLVSGRSRASVIGGSLLAAALPGLAAWAAMLAAAAWAGEPAFSRAFAPHRFAALVVVSTCGWAIGSVLPRLAGGALWIMLLVGLALTRGAFGHLVQMVETNGGGASGIVSSAFACVMCPLLLLGDYAGVRDPRVAAASILAALIIAGIAARHLCRRDYTLSGVA